MIGSWVTLKLVKYLSSTLYFIDMMYVRLFFRLSSDFLLFHIKMIFFDLRNLWDFPPHKIMHRLRLPVHIITIRLLRWHRISWMSLTSFAHILRWLSVTLKVHFTSTTFPQITTSLGYLHECWNANVLACIFLLHREDSTSATSEHREQPFHIIEW